MTCSPACSGTPSWDIKLNDNISKIVIHQCMNCHQSVTVGTNYEIVRDIFSCHQTVTPLSKFDHMMIREYGTQKPVGRISKIKDKSWRALFNTENSYFIEFPRSANPFMKLCLLYSVIVVDQANFNRRFMLSSGKGWASNSMFPFYCWF